MEKWLAHDFLRSLKLAEETRNDLTAATTPERVFYLKRRHERHVRDVLTWYAAHKHELTIALGLIK